MLQKSLGYAFKKIQKKIVILKKIKNCKIWAMNLSSDCFVKTSF